MKQSDISDLASQLEHLAPFFDVRGELGRGGMSLVVHAIDKVSRADVAIKIVKPGLLEDSLGHERVRREVALSRRLPETGVVRLLAVHDLPNGSIAMVSKYASGGTLKSLIKEHGPLDTERLVAIFVDLADALGAVHRAGIIHADVKPENVYLNDEGRALLGDFGIALWTTDSTMPRCLEGFGTPQYMSPEHIAGGLPDARSDLYSLGATAWEMAAGRPPWQGLDIDTVLERQRSSVLPAIGSFRNDVPTSVAGAIDRCLAKSPAARWQSAIELRDALRTQEVAKPKKKSRARAVGSQHHPSAIVTALVGGGALLLGAALWQTDRSFRVIPIATTMSAAPATRSLEDSAAATPTDSNVVDSSTQTRQDRSMRPQRPTVVRGTDEGESANGGVVSPVTERVPSDVERGLVTEAENRLTALQGVLESGSDSAYGHVMVMANRLARLSSLPESLRRRAEGLALRAQRACEAEQKVALAHGGTIVECRP